MSSPNVHQFTDANFDAEVLASDKPVLVDFWAPWCGPCRALGPTIDRIADELGDKVKVGKLNTEEHQQTAIRYNVTAIPLVLVFKGGQVTKRLVGLRPMGDLVAALGESVPA